jgi:hypothetical protein
MIERERPRGSRNVGGKEAVHNYCHSKSCFRYYVRNILGEGAGTKFREYRHAQSWFRKWSFRNGKTEDEFVNVARKSQNETICLAGLISLTNANIFFWIRWYLANGKKIWRLVKQISCTHSTANSYGFVEMANLLIEQSNKTCMALPSVTKCD